MTMSDEYKPISCDLHSQYELWIIRAQELKLAWQDDQGISRIERIKPVDVRAEAGIEYLYFEDTAESPQRVRLDHIFKANPVKG